jgi:hypothetical protein
VSYFTSEGFLSSSFCTGRCRVCGRRRYTGVIGAAVGVPHLRLLPCPARELGARPQAPSVVFASLTSSSKASDRAILRACRPRHHSGTATPPALLGRGSVRFSRWLPASFLPIPAISSYWRLQRGAGQPPALFDNRWYSSHVEQRSQRGPARRAAGEGLRHNGAEPLAGNVSPKDYAPFNRSSISGNLLLNC